MSDPLEIELHKRELIYSQAAYQEDLNKKIILKKLEEDHKNIMTKEDSQLFEYYLKVNVVKSSILTIPAGVAILLLKKRLLNYSMIQRSFIFLSIGSIPLFYYQFWFPPRGFRELSEFYYYKYFEKVSEKLAQQDKENKDTKSVSKVTSS
ncbi:unnamed protein product [Blepharisma stoltei]|uniref:Uncharacterized protein n=1 Tax=Blepharisma stoltei TaxID=1481888 RepID=A0AAU9ISB7_9CILI|nr:unnamed protein product [Blepharisma stoltei]